MSTPRKFATETNQDSSCNDENRQERIAILRMAIIARVYNDQDEEGALSQIKSSFDELDHHDQTKILKACINYLLEEKEERETTTYIRLFTFFIAELQFSQPLLNQLVIDILYNCLHPTWKLDAAETLFGLFDLAPLLTHFIIRAVNYRHNQVVTALLNLPVAWGLLSRDQLAALVHLWRNGETLNETQKKFLDSCIYPDKSNPRTPVPRIFTLKKFSLWGKKAKKDHEELILAMKTQFIAVCKSYIENYFLFENWHHQVANLVKNCLSELDDFSTRHYNATPDFHSFKIGALQTLYLSLKEYLIKNESVVFKNELNALATSFPRFIEKEKELLSSPTVAALTDAFTDVLKNDEDLQVTTVLDTIQQAYINAKQKTPGDIKPPGAFQ